MDKATICPYGNWFSGGYAPSPKTDNRPDTAMHIYRDVDRPWYDKQEFKTVIQQGVIDAYISNYHQGSLDSDDFVTMFDAYDRARNEKLAIAALEAYGRREGTVSPLGLSASSNHHKVFPEDSRSPFETTKRSGGKGSRGRYGQNGISAKGKREVKSAIGYLQETYDRLCLTLGTLTLPTLSPADMEKVAAEFGEILRTFMQEVKRQLERLGLPNEWVAVVELQEKRWRSWHQVVPHIHFVCVGRSWRTDDWALTKAWMDRTWGRILENFLGHPVAVGACCRVEVPKHNLRGELGKYLSKGGKVLQEIKDAGFAELLPRQWWSSSAPIKRAVKQARIHLSGNPATWIDRHLQELREEGLLTFRWVERPVANPVTGEITMRICGYAGQFTNKQAMRTVLERAKQGVKVPKIALLQDECA